MDRQRGGKKRECYVHAELCFGRITTQIEVINLLCNNQRKKDYKLCFKNQVNYTSPSSFLVSVTLCLKFLKHSPWCVQFLQNPTTYNPVLKVMITWSTPLDHNILEVMWPGFIHGLEVLMYLAPLTTFSLSHTYIDPLTLKDSTTIVLILSNYNSSTISMKLYCSTFT